VDFVLNTKRLVSNSLYAPTLTLAMLVSGSAVHAQIAPAPAPAPAAPAGQMGDNPSLRGDDITRQDVADMDWFLDRHPEIAEQLRKDPSLIDNQRWVADHPQLQEYMQTHRKIAEAFRQNPNLFMRDEERYDRTEGGDITRRDVVEMNRFLDDHREVAEQLRKDPSLIDNREWVASHPALQEYLQSHPAVRQAFRSDPNAFMHDEERLDQRERDRYDRRDYDRREADRTSANPYDGDERNRGELTGFGQFLGSHTSVADELSRDPSLANNREYLESHPELNDYLKAHPTMSQQLAANPQAVMTSNWVQKGGGFRAKPVGPTPRPNPTSNQ